MQALTNKLSLSKVHRIVQAAVPAGLNRRAQPERPRGIGRHAALNLTLTAALLLGAACGDSLVLSEEDQRHRPGAADAGGHTGGDPEERGDEPAPPPETPPEPGPNGMTEADPAAIDVHPEPNPEKVVEDDPAAIEVSSESIESDLPQPAVAGWIAEALGRALTVADCPGAGTVDRASLSWTGIGGGAGDLRLSGHIALDNAYQARCAWRVRILPKPTRAHCSRWDAACFARLEADCQQLCGTGEFCATTGDVGVEYFGGKLVRDAGSQDLRQWVYRRACAAGTWHPADDSAGRLNGVAEPAAQPLELHCVAANGPSAAMAWRCQVAAVEAAAAPDSPAIITARVCFARHLEKSLERASVGGSR